MCCGVGRKTRMGGWMRGLMDGRRDVSRIDCSRTSRQMAIEENCSNLYSERTSPVSVRRWEYYVSPPFIGADIARKNGDEWIDPAAVSTVGRRLECTLVRMIE